MKRLPPGWRWSTVAEVGDVDLGRQRHPDWHHGSEMRPYLRVANVFEDRIDTRDVKEMDFSGCFERFKLRAGDVLLNEGQTPELLGRPAIYRGIPADVAFTNSLIRFRAGPDVTPEWALAVFRHYMHSGRFTRESRITTNIAHLSAARFRAVEFPLPPLAEQRRIVDILDEHHSRLDAATRSLEAGTSRMDRLVRHDVASAITSLNAPVVTLQSVLARPLSNGRSVPTADVGFPVLRLTALRGDEVDLMERKIGRWDAAAASPFLVERGDFLLARGNGSIELVARGALVPEVGRPVAYPDTMIRVRVSDRLLPEYFNLVWNSPLVRRQIVALVRTTAGIFKINQGQLRQVEVPLPRMEDQAALVHELVERRAAYRRLNGALAGVGARRQSLRRQLLTVAFAGGLTCRTEEDVVEELANA